MVPISSAIESLTQRKKQKIKKRRMKMQVATIDASKIGVSTTNSITVNILGTVYEIVKRTLEEDKAFESCDGYCDPSVKKVFVRQYTEEEIASKDFGYKNFPEIQKRVIRHEIIHAFMYESGLWRNSLLFEEGWAMNEEMVDWMAIQMPKINKCFEEAGVLTANM